MTGARQDPHLYGSMGGTIIALVPAETSLGAAAGAAPSPSAEGCEARNASSASAVPTRTADSYSRQVSLLRPRHQMMPCFLRSACSSPDTQPKTFGSPSSSWTK